MEVGSDVLRAKEGTRAPNGDEEELSAELCAGSEAGLRAMSTEGGLAAISSKEESMESST